MDVKHIIALRCIGNASAATLGSLYGILGNPATSIATKIDGISAGYPVGTAIEQRFLILDANNDPKTGVAANCATTCYDQAHANDDVDNPCNVSELGATGCYYFGFTPDAAGAWSVLVDCSSPNCAQLFTYKVG